MSRVVEMWVNELAKLGERPQARGAYRWGKASAADQPLKGGDAGKEEEARKGESTPRASSDQVEQRPARRSTLSETTVCMLMDRFAPC